MSEKLLGKSNDSLKKSNNSMKSMVKSSIVNKSSQKFSMKKCNPSLNKVPLSSVSDVMAKALDEKSSRIDNSSSTNNRLLLNQIFDQTADNSNENDWIACKAINLGEQISAEQQQKSSIETLKSSAIDDCKSNITKSKLK